METINSFPPQCQPVRTFGEIGFRSSPFSSSPLRRRITQVQNEYRCKTQNLSEYNSTCCLYFLAIPVIRWFLARLFQINQQMTPKDGKKGRISRCVDDGGDE